MFFSAKPKALKYGERHVFQHESLGDNWLLHLPWRCRQCRHALDRNSGDGGDLWVLLVQGWTEPNPGRLERDEERSLQTQSLNPTLWFTGAAAISEDEEGLPQSTHQALKLCGMSIIPRKLSSSSAGECAHACAALVVPQPVEWEPQHPGSGRACAWLPVAPRAAPPSEEQVEDPYDSLQSPRILRGWQGSRFLAGGRLSHSFAPEGARWLPFASGGIVGQSPGGRIRRKPGLSQPQRAHSALLRTPWVVVM